MPLAKYSSTSGNLVIAGAWMASSGSILAASWSWVAALWIPWTGTTTYSFIIYNSAYANSLYIKIQTTEYDPYSLPAGPSYTVCSLNYQISNPSLINVLMHKSSFDTTVYCKSIILKTGNPDCMYKATFIPGSLSYENEYFMVT